MTDLELRALVALEENWTMLAAGDNLFREHQGLSPAWGTEGGWGDIEKAIRAELVRRGVLKEDT